MRSLSRLSHIQAELGEPADPETACAYGGAPMKRDIDLARQLLLDIESRGSDCSVSVLRTEPNHESEERVRYHLRLLIDAGLLKEIDRTSAGIPCVRLTHDGHELLELSRRESLWREAKGICRERLGGLSLSVIRQLLVRLAWGRPLRRPLPPRRKYVARHPLYDTETYRIEPYRYAEPPLEDAGSEEGNVRYVRVRPELVDLDEQFVRSGIDWDGDGQTDWEYDAMFPSNLI